MSHRDETKTMINDLVKLYPSIRPIVLAIPFIGSLTDAEIVQYLSKYQKERLKTFLEGVNLGNAELTDEIIKSEDFLHCFHLTLNAVVKTRQRKKIEYFAKLFSKSFSENSIRSVGEYEDYVKLLDELTFREIKVLVILEKHENEAKKAWNGYENRVKEPSKYNRGRYWDNFANEVELKCGIRGESIEAILTRISRSGCFKTHFGYVDANDPLASHFGFLTPLYFDLKKQIGV